MGEETEITRATAELASIVAEMREAQKEYFRTRSTGALDRSKALEKKVDARVREILTPQRKLF